MKMLGKSRAIAVFATSLGLIGLTFATPAFAQGAAPAKPADKPAAPPAAAAPAGATPAKPATPAAPAGAAGAAGATAKPADPKALFASGEKKFKANDFAGALADFEASNAAKGDAATTRYVALSHDNLQHYPEAVTAFEKFIAENPAKMKTEVEEAQKRVAAIKAMPGKVHVETTPPGASIVIDTAQAPHPTVTPTDIELPAGKHTLLIGAEGYDNTTKEIDVTFASKQDLKAELQKKAEAPPPPPPVVAEKPAAPASPPPPPPEPRSKVPAYVTGAVAIVAAGVGTGFGIKALSQSSDFESKPTTKRADDGENNALVADMMFGIAITFGVTSAVLFLSSDAPSTAKADGAKTASAPKPKKKAPSIIPAPYVSPSGGGASALIRF